MKYIGKCVRGDGWATMRSDACIPYTVIGPTDFYSRQELRQSGKRRKRKKNLLILLTNVPSNGFIVKTNTIDNAII